MQVPNMSHDLEVDEENRKLREENRRLQLALQGAGHGVWDHDLATGQVVYSDTWRKIRGYGPTEDVDALSAPWIDRIHPVDRPRIQSMIARQDNGELKENAFEYRERHRDGHWIWILSRGRPVQWLPDGRVARILGTDTDISALKEAELALAEEKERLLVTLRSIGEALICVDNVGMITSFNASAASLTGWPASEAMGQPIPQVLDLRSRDNQALTENLISQALSSDSTSPLTDAATVVQRNGTQRWANLSIAPVYIRDRTAGVVAVLRDATDEFDLNEHLQHAATHDALTGLYNRRGFETAASEFLKTVPVGAIGGAMCMLDLDGFKAVNDTAGHAAGDQVLERGAAKLQGCCSSADIFGRIGGDEFALLLVARGKEEILATCERFI
jgi:diguanylate cyclase